MRTRFGTDLRCAAPPTRRRRPATPPASGPSRAGRPLLDRPPRPGVTPFGKSYRDVVRTGFRGGSPAPDLVAFPGPGRRGRPPRLVRRRRHRRHPVRRVVGGRRRRGDVGDGYAVGVPSTSPGSTGCSRSTRDRTAHPAGALGPGARDQLRPGATRCPLPQSFEVLDPRQLARHRSRRSLRHRVHPIDDPRGSMRIADTDGVSESQRLPAPARARRPTPSSSARRARSGSSFGRGCASRDRPVAQDLRRHARFADFDAAVAATRPSASRPLPPTAGCSTPARPPPPQAWTTAPTCSSSASRVGRPPLRPGSTGRSSWSPTTGGVVPSSVTIQRRLGRHRCRRPRGCGRRLAQLVPAGALPARRPRAHEA